MNNYIHKLNNYQCVALDANDNIYMCRSIYEYMNDFIYECRMMNNYIHMINTN